MQKLIEKLEELAAPNREIDAEIMFDLFAKPVGTKSGGPSGYLWPENDPCWSFGMRFPGKDRDWFAHTRRGSERETLLIERDGALVLMNSFRIPKLTASIDDALEISHKALPGCEFELSTMGGLARAVCHWDDRAFEGQRTGGMLSIAVLLAAIRALHSKSGTSSGCRL